MTSSGHARLLAALGAIVLVALIASGISPHDRATWVMEVMPIFVVVPLIAATDRRFPLTDLVLVLIAVHAIVLAVGGAYTYARVPFGFWMQHVLDTTRNPYDKVGHFMQGLVPALAAREVVLRNKLVSGRRMAAFVAVCTALSVSLCYELIEWWAALAMGQGADEFLGTQGDPWDTQSDMFFALVGACFAIVALSRLHDARMRALPPPAG
jgi:putative membrane protein